MPELLIVDAETVRPLREAILRPGRPAEESRYPQDDDERAMHLAIVEDDEVLAVASMLPDAEGAPGGESWRVRGLAVAEGRRRAGLGRQLLATLLAVAEKRGGGLWCNARTDVQGFYAALGLAPRGEPSDVPGTGPHVPMSWRPRD